MKDHGIATDTETAAFTVVAQIVRQVLVIRGQRPRQGRAVYSR